MKPRREKVSVTFLSLQANDTHAYNIFIIIIIIIIIMDNFCIELFFIRNELTALGREVAVVSFEA